MNNRKGIFRLMRLAFFIIAIVLLVLFAMNGWDATAMLAQVGSWLS